MTEEKLQTSLFNRMRKTFINFIITYEYSNDVIMFERKTSLSERFLSR